MLFILLAALSAYLLLGIAYFGFRRSGYSQLRHTISELGEAGARHQRAVSWGVFFPVGAGLLLLATCCADTQALHGLLLCLGAGYVVAAVFPCDPGSPSSGSLRQAIHNLGGALEYVGGIYFLYQAQNGLFLHETIGPQAQLAVLGGCVVATSFPDFPLRGLAQRVAELFLFGQALWLSSQLP
ncbi:DUF998 domain-containing protein [Hymenobacter lucidus]|uniref:DUF998 domain-containing protein n=1 Tax=Hymenobacter lucidus TaxID=2880930 RepID=A0ABS8AQR1_9BACT|nr:DUF998 domain-containing protein [Hymenobacter lucidus]MCB2407943.1 DUF998 domain-containing protein [Hymenobacter lucidus]